MNTPRTDAESFVLCSVRANQISPDTVVVSADFARQLETEVQELRAALERAIAEEDSGFGISDETVEKFRSLIAKVPK